MADPPPYPGAPRWVKISGMIAIGLVLLVVILLVTGIGGPHGPGRHVHMPFGEVDGDTPPPSVTDDAAPSSGPAGHPPAVGGY